MSSDWLLLNKPILALYAFALIIAGSCKGPDHIVNSTADTSNCLPIEESAMKFNAVEPLKEVEVIRGYQMQDCLVLEVSHAGCGNEQVELIWDGILMKSMPPRIRLKPQLNKAGTCEQRITETVSFDMEKLLMQHGKLIVILPGISEPVRMDIN